MSLPRRHFLIGSALLLGAGPSHAANETAAAKLTEIETSLGGRLGVFARNTGNGRVMGHRAGERFAMCSTFKATLVAAVLARVDRGGLALDRMVPYGKADLLSHAPVGEAHVGEGALDLESLCAAAVEESDNTAANLLLGLIGGPPGVTAFFRELGDKVSRLDRIELALNSNLPGDPRDTTTPEAMAGVLERLLVGEKALSAASRARLTGWMENNRNGAARLRAGLPPDWRLADKTGTSDNGAVNDIGVLWPAGKPPILLTVYTDTPGAAVAKGEASIAEVAKVVAEVFA